MQRMACGWCLAMACGVGLYAEDRPVKVVYEDDNIRVETKTGATTKSEKARTDEPQAEVLVPRTYHVADVLTCLQTPEAKQKQPSKLLEASFQTLIEHLQRSTGENHWKDEQGSIRSYETTLSLVIRTTPQMHERIAEELGRLRKEGIVTVSVAIAFVTGPRRELQELMTAFPGELGKVEQEQLLEKITNSTTLTANFAPKVTTFNRQTAIASSDETHVMVHSTLAADRRSVRLKVAAAAKDDVTDLIASLQTVDLHSGRATALHFESAPVIVGLPPADDAQELLLIVTPTINVLKEEEELLGAPKVSAKAVENPISFTVIPTIIIQEEEEELLGIPTGSSKDEK